MLAPGLSCKLSARDTGRAMSERKRRASQRPIGGDMLRGIRSRLTYANVTATIALFVALGGGAYAATSLVGGIGVIHGCVAGNGSLVLVKAGKRCSKGKAAIAWNQRGVQGPAGGQ